MLASGQGDRGGNQIRLRPGPGPAVRHVRELPGQARAAPRLDDLADRQMVDDDAGGERPVAGFGGVPHRVGELAVPFIPPGLLAGAAGPSGPGTRGSSFRRSTSANNVWERYHPDPIGWTNPFACAKASQDSAPARCPPVQWRLRR